jgi:hypothetical protein
MKNWKFWDWTAYGCLAVAALVTAFDSALKNAPALANRLPGLVESPLWAFTPAILVVIATTLLIFRGRQGETTQKTDVTQRGLPLRAFPKIRYEPETDFALLPQHFTVDLAAQFPHIEVCFFAVSFLPRPIKLTDVDLSLQLYGAAALEDIKFRQKDWQVNPKECELVTCRRNLTDLERTKLPWQTGRVTAAFQLSAKATDGDKTLSYGPVSSKVIEGWVNVPPPPPRPSTRI